MKRWEVGNKSKIKNKILKIDEIIKILLENRGLKTKKEIQAFLYPKLEEITIDSVGIDKKRLKRAIARIKKAIEKNEQIVVFGDYDVDGICACAIVWETLHGMGAKILPYIPHRMNEGYGLSEKGISSVQSQIPNIKLIITVDNGIVAFDAVNFANKQGIDVIITDHHVPDASTKKKPNAYEIVHTTKLCGAGVAYLLMQEFKVDEKKTDHLELVALATIADLVPLKDANRTLVYHGLQKLHETKRIGLIELFKEAGLQQKDIDVYAIGHVIAPRLNAAGRLEYAMDSLRLLCTSNRERARKLAEQLGSVNRQRQLLTLSSVAHARLNVQEREKPKKLLFLFDESYQQGIIGLIAGRLTEEFYRPSIVISKGKEYSKASARSIRGFNIIEFIRSASQFLVDAGGHPMAAGFTVETKNLEKLQISLEDKAEEMLHEDLLIKSLHIDMQLPLEIVTQELFDAIKTLSPFGMNNPEPTFMSKDVVIADMKFIGKERKHIKFKFSSADKADQTDAIAFGFGERSSEFKIGDTVDIVYTIDENHWNGNTLLQLKLKDVRKT